MNKKELIEMRAVITAPFLNETAKCIYVYIVTHQEEISLIDISGEMKLPPKEVVMALNSLISTGFLKIVL